MEEHNHTCGDECWQQFPLFRGEGKAMANRAVFLDRDNTLIEDPGYLSEPSAVKLLPGVEQAVKSLESAGYKIVVVTNQSGIARGLLTEQMLEKIHDELRRQLSAKDAFLDAIYYCPFHPEGTVEGYVQDSELRKPHPGMLLKAASEMGLDLSQSWMIGDSPRDIEAGQRAHCRTIRVRTRPTVQKQVEQEDEDVQADFTVRNLVDAARIILRGQERASDGTLEAPYVPEPAEPADDTMPAAASPEASLLAAEAAPAPAEESGDGHAVDKAAAEAPVQGVSSAAVDASTTPTDRPTAATAAQTAAGVSAGRRIGQDDIALMSELDLHRQIVRLLRELMPARRQFSLSKFLAGVAFALAATSFGAGAICVLTQTAGAVLWMLSSVCLSGLAITLYIMQRD